MSRRRTRKEEIRNPENYFIRYIALEVKHDLEEQKEYYEMFESLDKLRENLERVRGDAQLLLATNLDGREYEKHLSENSFLAWTEYVEEPHLHLALSKLPKKDRTLLTLRFKYCLSQRQTAKILSVSHTAIRKQEDRIKKFIYEIFEKGFQNP